MRPAARIAVLFALAMSACATDGRPRVVAEEDGFSIVELPGWRPHRDRGSLVLHSPEALGGGRVTLAVRSVPLDAGWADARDPAHIVDATRKVLAALPAADLRGPVAVAVPGWDGARFDLSYVPERARGQRYDRAHIVLISAGSHIFHVVLTAPASERAAFERALPLLDEVVASLRQEG